jgi:8-oxo-dGTP diphosphatase
MSLYLVRHAKAGNRSEWRDDDRVRPLTPKGWRQADAIAARIAPLAPSVLLSSSYLRCRQTLEPLATATGLEVVDEPALVEGNPFEPVLGLLATLPDGAVLCSHGDVIPDTLAALDRRGCRFIGPVEWRKGSVWTLERVDSSIVAAEMWLPAD